MTPEHDDHTQVLIDRNSKEERIVSNGLYAPYLAWTILLSILALFGVAIAQKVISLIGL